MNQTRRPPIIATLLLAIAMTILLACGSESPTADPATSVPPTPENTARSTPTPETVSEAESRTTPTTVNRVQTRTQVPSTSTTAQQPTSTPSTNTIPTQTPTSTPPAPTPDTNSTDPTTTSQKPSPASPPTQVPAPTGGICHRNPAVQIAIQLAVSDNSSCSAITPDDLVRIKSLKFPAEAIDGTIEPGDLTGLESVTTLEVHLKFPSQAHFGSLTGLTEAKVSLSLPPESDDKVDTPDPALYEVPDDFLPHGETYDEYAQPVPNANPEGHFKTLQFVITGGATPRYEYYANMAHSLLDRRYHANHLTIEDSSTQAYDIFKYTNLRTPTEFLTGTSVDELTLILDRPHETKNHGVSASENWLSRDSVSRITIINEDPNVTIRLPNNFMYKDRYLYPVSRHQYELEISGRVVTSTRSFYEARGLERLDLSLDSGSPHYLAFASDVEPPQGTGFTVAER